MYIYTHTCARALLLRRQPCPNLLTPATLNPEPEQESRTQKDVQANLSLAQPQERETYVFQFHQEILMRQEAVLTRDASFSKSSAKGRTKRQ